MGIAAGIMTSLGTLPELPLAAAPSIITAVGTLEIERRREEKRTLDRRLKDAQYQAEHAQKINDDVVQHLALSSYAQQQNDPAEAQAQSELALQKARTMVEHLYLSAKETEEKP